jgi:hypothetical protein
MVLTIPVQLSDVGSRSRNYPEKSEIRWEFWQNGVIKTDILCNTAGIAQSVGWLDMGWTTEESKFEYR